MSLDESVLAYYNSPPEGITLRIDGIESSRRRRLCNGLILVFDEEHWRHKRGHEPRAPDPVAMDKPFDPTRFNFNKASPKETISKVTLRGAEHLLLVNISPLMVGHHIIPLWTERGLPQGALGCEGVLAMMEFAALSSRVDFRVGYNSLGAFASVNHLHIHGMYAAALDGAESTNQFPIEAAPRQAFATDGAVRVSRLAIDYQRGPCLNALVFEGANALDVAISAGSCVALLADRAVPHNVLARAMPTPAVFVVPRQQQENFDVAGAGCNAAVCEVCGFLFMQNAHAYDTLTAASAHSFFGHGASLGADATDVLLAQLAESLCWRSDRASFVQMLAVVSSAVVCLTLVAWTRRRP